MSLLDENIEISFESLLIGNGWKKEYGQVIPLSKYRRAINYIYTYEYICDISLLHITFRLQIRPKGYHLFNGIGPKGYKILRKPIMSVQILSHNIYSSNGMSQTFWIKNCEDVVGDIMEFIKISHHKEDFKKRYGKRYVSYLS